MCVCEHKTKKGEKNNKKRSMRIDEAALFKYYVYVYTYIGV